ncbi:MAG: substrate-binding domain-containing protein [Clostridia bacterium]|nr:substrate-binding domain-containing protein [Clostridia bacterium]
MQVFVVCQPGAAQTHWCALYLKGIYSEAKRKGDTVAVLSVEETAARFQKDPPPAAALLSNSRAWTANAAALLSSLGVQPIIIGGASRENYRHASYVYMDYREATVQLVEYLRAYDKHKIALFAVSPDSATDMIKRDAFLSCEDCTEADVFYYDGARMTDTSKNFLSAKIHYDAVLCANDAGAMVLLRELADAGVAVPDDLYLCTFGDMAVGFSGSLTVTTARLDCVEVGRQVISLLHLLTNSPRISGISTKIACELVLGNTTAQRPFLHATAKQAPLPETAPSKFHNDPSISRIFLADKILSNCDAIDVDMFKLILRGYKYIDIADMLHVSESTIKYRLKRILTLTGLADRDELVSIMEPFFK